MFDKIQKFTQAVEKVNTQTQEFLRRAQISLPEELQTRIEQELAWGTRLVDTVHQSPASHRPQQSLKRLPDSGPPDLGDLGRDSKRRRQNSPENT